MELSKSKENGLNKSHFSKLHDRIVNKYNKVQKRLHRNTYVESFGDSDNSLDNISSSELSKSTGDLFNEVFNNCNKSDHTKSELLYVNVQSINHPEVIDLSSSQSSLVIVGEGVGPSYDQFKSNDNNSSSSSESVNDNTDTDAKVNCIFKRNSLKKAKVSFRDRIGSRIAYAKERRRKISLEKNAAKQRKREEADKFSLGSYRSLTMSNYKRTKVGVVAVALIQASDWNNEVFADKQRQLFFRLKLGIEKLKTKVQKTTGKSAKWQEKFYMNLYDDTQLEIVLFDREVVVGRTSVNLMELEKEKTHQMRLTLADGELEVGNVQIFILVTISGAPNQTLELDESRSIMNIVQQNIWDYHKVGHLNVKIYGARGLPNSDYYCTLEFINEIRLTQIDMRTSNPDWMKSFNFLVTDITERLIFTISDNKKQEDVAKVIIPLLKIEQKRKRFYALKDGTLKERAQGNNPRILLEMKVTWNLAKASIRVINPKEQIYMDTEDKIDRHIFARNVTRAKFVYQSALASFRFWKSCFEWESKIMNVIALAAWIPFCWNFQVWMIPIIILMPFLWYAPTQTAKPSTISRTVSTTSAIVDTEKDKQSLVQKINSLQDIIQNVQNIVGDMARFGEQLKNLYNFTEPFLSFLAIFLMLFIAVVLFLIPPKIIFIAWGIKKYLNKIIRPNRVPNNEIVDLLSRVPDDEYLLDCQELQLRT